jgi:predicted nucleic acid-binding protein
MAILIDTNFLLAAIFPNDANHLKARKTIQTLDPTFSIVPAPVLQEFFYMTTVRLNFAQAVNYLEQVQRTGFDIQPLVQEDRKRMIEILRRYASSAFDYTDAAIMALSERLNITQVYTFDRRDFTVFRPKHCDYLELLL